jgi:hypothetical protein
MEDCIQPFNCKHTSQRLNLTLFLCQLFHAVPRPLVINLHYLVQVMLKRRANLAEYVLGISCRRSLCPAAKLSLYESVFSASELVFDRNVLIQKGAEFVVDNDWGTLERTLADRCPDGFSSSIV